jgi:hypothetical protein
MHICNITYTKEGTILTRKILSDFESFDAAFYDIVIKIDKLFYNNINSIEMLTIKRNDCIDNAFEFVKNSNNKVYEELKEFWQTIKDEY